MFTSKKAVFLVILASLLSLITVCTKGECGEWVQFFGDENSTYYYDLTSIKPATKQMDKDNKSIQVRIKQVLTKKGRIAWSKNDKKYQDADFILSLDIFDKSGKSGYTFERIVYSKSGTVLDRYKVTNENWCDVMPGSEMSVLFYKLKNANIIK